MCATRLRLTALMMRKDVQYKDANDLNIYFSLFGSVKCSFRFT